MPELGTLVSFFPSGKVVVETVTKGAIDGGSWLIKQFGKRTKNIQTGGRKNLSSIDEYFRI